MMNVRATFGAGAALLALSPPLTVLADELSGATSSTVAFDVATSTAAAAKPSTPEPAPAPALVVTPLGWIEASFTYAFARPSNGIVNFRGFGNRHNTVTIENVAVGAQWSLGSVGGKIVLQVGATPSTYYLAEPLLAGAGGANATGPELWKYLQEANVSWKAPIGRGLLVQAGLFTSPIGPEVFAIKDDWNWSRSNLFFGLPFYHTGVKLTYELDDRLSATLALYNGWNSVVDNNDGKSIAFNVGYKIPNLLLAQLLYFGGPERSRGGPEGEPWRHDFDVYAQLDVTDWLALLAQANAGIESTSFGAASWIAAALYARVKVFDQLFIALRGDRFHETVPSGASPIFWAGAEWVTSGTVTIDARPADNFLVRIELRHDAAEKPLFFDDAAGDAPSSDTQDTLTVGVTSWF